MQEDVLQEAEPDESTSLLADIRSGTTIDEFQVVGAPVERVTHI